VTYAVTYTDANFNTSTLALGASPQHDRHRQRHGVGGRRQRRLAHGDDQRHHGTGPWASRSGRAPRATRGNTAATAGPGATFSVVNDSTLSALTGSPAPLTAIPAAFSPPRRLPDHLSGVRHFGKGETDGGGSGRDHYGDGRWCVGTFSGAIPIPAGRATSSSRDGAGRVTKTTYTITVTRPVSTDADLSKLASSAGN